MGRAAAASAAAFFMAFAAELALLPLAVALAPALPLMAVLVAPAMEEGAKRLCVAWFRLPWLPVGLGFGLLEGGFKLWQSGAWAGGLASVALHAALAGFAARYGVLRASLPLHAGFNALVIASEVGLGLPAEGAALGLALALLLASRRLPVDAGQRPA
ncbi:hypothetical protein [Sabulicella glaciei]|uniref:CPBP family intramembrane metalloprotease n=1 Tax=Sabulicella glaciei TaxID=2984948 RepID=A0ABT3NWW8_9PROT|nr:hypothetical protein [Roseococcus sp. MDT2-1-1]MCW8086662.1 hypothetical protein [Roseococcus sp. MDT2-1-1]